MVITSSGNEYQRIVLFGLAAGLDVKKVQWVQKLKKMRLRKDFKACFIA